MGDLSTEKQETRRSDNEGVTERVVAIERLRVNNHVILSAMPILD
jgi:hypothetical protein